MASQYPAPVPAQYVGPDQCSVGPDRAPEFLPGVRVWADCGPAGAVLATVRTCAVDPARALLTLDCDAGGLTAGLVGLLHSNDNPESLCNHAAQHAAGGRDALPAASVDQAGLAALASIIETLAGALTTKAVTPAGVAAAIIAACGVNPWQLVRAGELGTAAWLDQTWIFGSKSWDVGSLASGGQTYTTVSVPGAHYGDFVLASVYGNLSGLALRGEVVSPDTVSLFLSNLTGSAVDLPSAVYYIAVLKRIPAR